MKGIVDDRNRALIDVPVRKTTTSTPTNVAAWIDTAFDGHLVFPLPLIKDLELESLAETEAMLADGSKITLEAFLCYVDWFGNRTPVQVIANEGKIPLLGTGLLEGRVLHINYSDKQVSID